MTRESEVSIRARLVRSDERNDAWHRAVSELLSTRTKKFGKDRLRLRYNAAFLSTLDRCIRSTLNPSATKMKMTFHTACGTEWSWFTQHASQNTLLWTFRTQPGILWGVPRAHQSPVHIEWTLGNWANTYENVWDKVPQQPYVSGLLANTLIRNTSCEIMLRRSRCWPRATVCINQSPGTLTHLHWLSVIPPKHSTSDTRTSIQSLRCEYTLSCWKNRSARAGHWLYISYKSWANQHAQLWGCVAYHIVSSTLW